MLNTLYSKKKKTTNTSMFDHFSYDLLNFRGLKKTTLEYCGTQNPYFLDFQFFVKKFFDIKTLFPKIGTAINLHILSLQYACFYFYSVLYTIN